MVGRDYCYNGHPLPSKSRNKRNTVLLAVQATAVIVSVVSLAFLMLAL